MVMGVPSKYELTATTDPYYCSTYVKVKVTRAGDDRHPLAQPAAKRIGVMVATPPLNALLSRHVDPRVYLPSQDLGANARDIVDDVAAKRTDAALVWGPIAGYFAARETPPLRLAPIPADVTGDLRMTFPISMGVRHSDKARLAHLNDLLRQHAGEIRAILATYGVPLADPASPQCRPRQEQASAAPMPAMVQTASARPAAFFPLLHLTAAEQPGTGGAGPAGQGQQKQAGANAFDCGKIKGLADVADLGSDSKSGAKPYTAEDGKIGQTAYIGWTRFAGFCERCHGPGGVGSSLAPDLTAAIESLNQKQFDAIVTCGIKGNQGTGVMPAWGNNPNIEPYLPQLWAYLKARGDGVIGAGRPEKIDGSS